MKLEEAMGLALEEAQRAIEHEDVPVGALVIVDDTVIASRHNERQLTGDPTAHAEILALRDAASKLGNWYLDEATLVEMRSADGNLSFRRLVILARRDGGGERSALVRRFAERASAMHTCMADVSTGATVLPIRSDINRSRTINQPSSSAHTACATSKCTRRWRRRRRASSTSPALPGSERATTRRMRSPPSRRGTPRCAPPCPQAVCSSSRRASTATRSSRAFSA